MLIEGEIMLNNESANMSYVEAQEAFERLLKLEYHPVAINFFKSSEEA